MKAFMAFLFWAALTFIAFLGLWWFLYYAMFAVMR